MVKTIVNVPQYTDPTLPKRYKNPNLLSTQIRMDNSSSITYVVKKFKKGTYKIFTYQQNQSSGCYYLVGKQSGVCSR